MVRELQWGSKGTAKGFYCAYGGGTAMGLKRDCKGAPLWPWWWDCNGAQKGLQRGSTVAMVGGLQWGSKGTAKEPPIGEPPLCIICIFGTMLTLLESRD